LVKHTDLFVDSRKSSAKKEKEKVKLDKYGRKVQRNLP
jgi:hypothetical protein